MSNTLYINNIINTNTNKRSFDSTIMSCNICTDKLNNSTRKAINCNYCNFPACRTCCETYITSENIPKCMNIKCGKEWTRKFIAENFTNAFITSKFKKHKENLLYDRERSMMPETQIIIERQKEAKAREALKVEAEIDLMRHRCEMTAARLRKQLNGELKKEMYEKETELSNNYYKLAYGINNSTASASASEEKERKRFIKSCADPECKGFLSMQWKCGLCDKWTCPECHVLKGLERDCEHTCNPDDVATAKLLAKDTKACPNCQTGIFKIDGCFAKDTPILTWEGEIVPIQDIELGMEVIGEEAEIRTVVDTFSGEDEMYLIEQQAGINYTVNSKHRLLLRREIFNDKGHNAGFQIAEMTVEDFINEIDDEDKKDYYGFKIMRDDIINLSSIKVTPVGRGTYYGFTLNQDNRFLLSDLTVVSNCDQMWCTQCHTAFSWRTGQIETKIHNPHYYEYMRNKNGSVPREPNDTPAQFCGAINHDTPNNIYRIITNKKHTKLNYKYSKQGIDDDVGYYNKLSERIRQIEHIRYVNIPHFNIDVLKLNENLRVKYMTNEITQEKFKTLIQRNDKRHQKYNEITDVLNLVVTAATDIINRFANNLTVCEPNKYDLTILNELNELVDYANSLLKDIAKVYKCVTYYFNNELKFDTLEKNVSETSSVATNTILYESEDEQEYL